MPSARHAAWRYVVGRIKEYRVRTETLHNPPLRVIPSSLRRRPRRSPLSGRHAMDPAGLGSSCRSRFSPVSSVALFLGYLLKAFNAETCSSSRRWRRSGSIAHSSLPGSSACGRPNGSSTPSRPSPDRSRSWSTSDAIRTASPSPNNRLLAIEDGTVRFRWKDYWDDNRQKVMTVSADEFIRRFLLHVVPEGFHRVRCYGFLGNRHRAQKLARCRELLGMPVSSHYMTDPNRITAIIMKSSPGLPATSGLSPGQIVTIETFDGITTRPPDPGHIMTAASFYLSTRANLPGATKPPQGCRCHSASQTLPRAVPLLCAAPPEHLPMPPFVPHKPHSCPERTSVPPPCAIAASSNSP